MRFLVFLISLQVLFGCGNQSDLLPDSEGSILFERVGQTDYCVPLRTPEGDRIFLELMRFINEKRNILIGKDKSTWRIYGPLQCDNKILFSAKKDLTIKDGRIYLEVGAHFTVNYHEKTKTFEIIGGK